MRMDSREWRDELELARREKEEIRFERVAEVIVDQARASAKDGSMLGRLLGEMRDLVEGTGEWDDLVANYPILKCDLQSAAFQDATKVLAVPNWYGLTADEDAVRVELEAEA